MSMKIVVARPPMFDTIAAAFPMARNPGVVFAWGDTIYNPSGIVISPELKAHEAVHAVQHTSRGMTPQMWWERYIDDPEFRLLQEIPAYRAQAAAFKNRHKDRNAYYQYAHSLAAIVAGGLYGHNLITAAEARRRILA